MSTRYTAALLDARRVLVVAVEIYFNTLFVRGIICPFDNSIERDVTTSRQRYILRSSGIIPDRRQSLGLALRHR